MKTAFSFDDVLLIPRYSTIASRKDVSTITYVAGNSLRVPIISSNMDTVTTSNMANAMVENGGIGCLHRFLSIEDNINEYKKSHENTWCSFGVGRKELERLEALFSTGCNTFVLDVAHGAAEHVVSTVKQAKNIIGSNAALIVGNFATVESIKAFNYHLGYEVDAYKVGIGGGSMCTTRVVTGCGLPTFASLLEMKSLELNLIADGGIRNSGDYAKALAVGAKAIMLGKLLAGSKESPGEILYKNKFGHFLTEEEHFPRNFINGEWQIDKSFNSDLSLYKNYRGSASAESYKVQGKTSEWRSPEGESTLVPCTGPVKHTIEQLQGGLRSAMSYVGANNLSEFRENSEFVVVTSNGLNESLPHGKLD